MPTEPSISLPREERRWRTLRGFRRHIEAEAARLDAEEEARVVEAWVDEVLEAEMERAWVEALSRGL